MLRKRIIPCLDVRDGRVVKGVKFQDLRDVGDPAELAERYEAEGADEVVFLDVTATLEGRKALLDAVRRTAERLFVPLTVGGGVRTIDDVQTLLRAGADKVALNTAAVETPTLVSAAARSFGAQCVVVAVDSKRAASGDRVFTRAGTRDSGRETIAWCREAERLGAGELLLTSIDADGTKAGYDIDLTRRAVSAVGVPVIASGGCGSAAHIVDVFRETGCAAALAASIFHFRTHTIADVKAALRAAHVPIRTADAHR